MTNVLVIDDESSIRTMLQDTLESKSYRVEAVANYESAEKILKNQSIDLVITDIFMPDMDGFEVIEALRLDFPHLKIIAMTGGGLFGAKDIVIKLVQDQGVHGYLLKPFNIDDLLEAVKLVVS